MPTKTHTTAVVLIPPEAIQPPIQAIRRVHDRNFQRWMPHITLLYPFAPRQDFQDIIPALAKSAQQTTPFSITFGIFSMLFVTENRAHFSLFPNPKTRSCNYTAHSINIFQITTTRHNLRVDLTHTSRSDNSSTDLSMTYNNDYKMSGNLLSLRSNLYHLSTDRKKTNDRFCRSRKLSLSERSQ